MLSKSQAALPAQPSRLKPDTKDYKYNYKDVKYNYKDIKDSYKPLSPRPLKASLGSPVAKAPIRVNT